MVTLHCVGLEMLDGRTTHQLRMGQKTNLRSDTEMIAGEALDKSHKIHRLLSESRDVIGKPDREAALKMAISRVLNAQKEFLILWNTKQRTGE